MTPSVLSFLAGLALYGSSLVSATSSGSIVNVGYASYQGNQSYANTVAYLGIPYAEPPLGDLRFRAPLPLNTSRIAQLANGQVVDATKYPNFCVQGTTGGGDAGGAGSEDCLNINIYAPYGATNTSNLPVLVYIHGGGYVYGNPANWPFDAWINQSPNVVIVSVYYRLDSFGFLSTPEFVTDSTLGDLNVGFQDQVQSLKWIKQYISAFGGDPSQVTINGESAGGSSIELHLVANEGESLFSAAIAQSVYRAPVSLPEQSQPLFQYYAQQAGCGSASEPTIASQMTCLRNASISALARAQDASNYNFTGPYKNFIPVVDGKLITQYPTLSILQGKFAHVPLIVGAVSNETLAGGTNISAALQAFFPSLTSADLADFMAAYPSTEFSSTNEWQRVATGEPSVRCARTIMGLAFSSFAPTWTYRYNQRNPTQSPTDLAVEHASENWMMFRGTNTGYNGTTTFTPQTPVELAFASELIAYWLSFTRSHDPNTFKLAMSPNWTAYGVGERVRMVLQQDPQNSTDVSGSFVESEPDLETARCSLVATKVLRTED